MVLQGGLEQKRKQEEEAKKKKSEVRAAWSQCVST